MVDSTEETIEISRFACTNQNPVCHEWGAMMRIIDLIVQKAIEACAGKLTASFTTIEKNCLTLISPQGQAVYL
jgi:hypothetical protein